MSGLSPIDDSFFLPRTHRAALLDTPGIFAYHRFGEASGTASIDVLGNNNGVYTGSPTLGVTSLIVNSPSTCVTFNGTTQYEAVATIPILTAANWTIGCLVKPANINQYGCIVWWGAENGRGFFIGATSGLTNPGDKLLPSFGLTWPGNNPAYTFPNNTTAHHLIMTNDGITTKVYVDGNITYTDAVLAPVVPNRTYISAGTAIFQANTLFAGTVQDRFLISRAITAIEASHLARVALSGLIFP